MFVPRHRVSGMIVGVSNLASYVRLTWNRQGGRGVWLCRLSKVIVQCDSSQESQLRLALLTFIPQYHPPLLPYQPNPGFLTRVGLNISTKTDRAAKA